MCCQAQLQATSVEATSKGLAAVMAANVHVAAREGLSHMDQDGRQVGSKHVVIFHINLPILVCAARFGLQPTDAAGCPTMSAELGTAYLLFLHRQTTQVCNASKSLTTPRITQQLELRTLRSYLAPQQGPCTSKVG